MVHILIKLQEKTNDAAGRLVVNSIYAEEQQEVSTRCDKSLREMEVSDKEIDSNDIVPCHLAKDAFANLL